MDNGPSQGLIDTGNPLPTYIIDANGNVVDMAPGVLKADDIVQAVQRL